MPQAFDEALGEVRELLRLDGGDLELLELDEETGTARLRLRFDDADCAECVLPRAMLTDVLRRALERRESGVASFEIEDPRER